MPFSLTCPACRVALNIPDSLAGKQCRCPVCSDVFATGRPPPPVAVPIPVPGPVVPTAQKPKGPQVFISFSNTDRPFVEKEIRPLLADHGISRWWSAENIQPGEEWEKAIHAALADSDWFLVVLSPRSALSEWVRKEVTWAFERLPDRIIPVLMERCASLASIHPRLPHLHFADFAANPVAAKRSILTLILDRLNRDYRKEHAENVNLRQAHQTIAEEKAHLKEEVRSLTEQLQGVTSWDGKWTRHGEKAPAGFRPLKERRAPIVSLMNLKGGVGKSTLTANLGATFWSDPTQPMKVLLVDLDYQASLTKMCLDPREVEETRRHRRLVSNLFGQAKPSPAFVALNAGRIGATKGYLLASDFSLQNEEALAQARWLVGGMGTDPRYLLRQVLHSDEVQREFDLILLDCPPRLGTACVNALTCSDYVLIPVLLDMTSVMAVPRLLSALRELKPHLFPNLSVLGVVANRKGSVKGGLMMREKEVWNDLPGLCADEWKESVYQFQTLVPTFSEASRQRQFPALHPDMNPYFRKLASDIRQRIPSLQGVKT
jgi:cellulose biosynthesis protein BcsQ